MKPETGPGAQTRSPESPGRPAFLQQMASTRSSVDTVAATDHGAVGSPESATAESGKRMAEVTIGRIVEVCQELLGQPILRGRQKKHRENDQGLDGSVRERVKGCVTPLAQSLKGGTQQRHA